MCLKRGKAPGFDGLDGILNEMVMFSGGRLEEVMLQEMNLVMRSPADWKKILLVPLHKNDDNVEVKNYREIALSCSVAMVFIRVLVRRWEGLLRIGF